MQSEGSAWALPQQRLHGSRCGHYAEQADLIHLAAVVPRMRSGRILIISEAARAAPIVLAI